MSDLKCDLAWVISAMRAWEQMDGSASKLNDEIARVSHAAYMFLYHHHAEILRNAEDAARAEAAERELASLRERIARAPVGRLGEHLCQDGQPYNVVLGPELDYAATAEITALIGKRVALVVLDERGEAE